VPLHFFRRHRASLIPLAFTFPFIAVLFQFALIEAGFGEPYPAIIMPDFRGTGGAQGAATVTVIEIEVTFADRSVAHPALATLLAPLPGSMAAQVSRNFRATPTGPVPPRAGVKAWLVDHLTPMRTLRLRRFAAGNPPQADTVQWLRERLERLYPGKPIERVDFNWFRNVYRLRGLTLQLVEHVAVESYRVDLGP
jgi:hypothetical protein